MDEPERSHRTRSRAAPDWTLEESLVLVNEINAVESEWGATLPSFQKWQQIVENCNTLDVNRNLNQCKRKWDELLSEYRRVKRESPENGSFSVELFEAIDRCVSGRANKNSGGAEEEKQEAAAAVDEEQLIMDTDPDSDPEAHGVVTEFFLETGSKKQKRRMKRRKRRLEMQNPWGYTTSAKPNQAESSSINENARSTKKNIVENVAQDIYPEPKEQKMATMLWENALQINRILEGNLADEVSHKSADLKNAEAVQTEFIRHQGDKLIDCLGKISATLNQLCDLVQHGN